MRVAVAPPLRYQYRMRVWSWAGSGRGRVVLVGLLRLVGRLQLVCRYAIGRRGLGDAPVAEGGSNDALSSTESCYDAAHEGKGTVSFQIDGRAVQLTATSSWVNVLLGRYYPARRRRRSA